MTADCLGDTALVRELFPALGDFAAELNLAERIRSGLRLLMLLLMLTLASLRLAACWPYWSWSFAGLAVLALLVAAVAFSLQLSPTDGDGARHGDSHPTAEAGPRLAAELADGLAWPHQKAPPTLASPLARQRSA
jgi:hypothetical protein